MTDPKKSPILEAVLISALCSLFTGLINLILEEIKEHRKKNKDDQPTKDSPGKST